MNDLNQLNEILFNTLQGVVDGNVDDKKAQAIVGLSNSIINTGKLQLNAYKLAKAQKAPDMFGLEQGTPQAVAQIEGKDKHAQMLNFAMFSGYDNTAQAIKELGKETFEKRYQTYKSNQ